MSFLYENIAKPVLFSLSAERAHEFGIGALRRALGTRAARKIARKRYVSDALKPINLFGLRFANPVGIAAGFDKNGKVINQLAALGFGFVEIGTVTYEPQPGNEKPRLFRLPQDRALINRLGFNNEGAKRVAERMRSTSAECVVGVNIGRNKNVDNEDAIANYLASFDELYGCADYFAVNISSPNTPGLRELQQKESVTSLINALQNRNIELAGDSKPKPMLLKIAPDLSDPEVKLIAQAAVEAGASGIIATNTTIGREGLSASEGEVAQIGAGGLSGAPVKDRSTEIIRKVYRYTDGACPIIGVGGVFTSNDAYEKIAAGASLVQAYTGFVYQGPRFAADICDGLSEILMKKGFENISDAVGSGA